MPTLPPSLLTHLQTDVQILERLVQRSADQHKSAIFFQSAKHVLRVGKRVVLAVEELKVETAVAEGSKDGMKRQRKIKQLVKIFATTLLNSSRKNSQQVQLLYFLPLTTLFQAIYGRLFTLTLSLGPVLGIDAETMCGIKPTFGFNSTYMVDKTKFASGAGEDFGQKIERGAVSASASRESTLRQTATPTGNSRLPTPAPLIHEEKTSSSVLPDVPSALPLPLPPPPSSSLQRDNDTAETKTSELKAIPADLEEAVASRPVKRASPMTLAAPQVKKKKKASIADDSLDSIFGDTKKKQRVVAKEESKIKSKKKKKKVDDIEAIFG